MNSSNFDNDSKTSTFKNFKPLLNTKNLMLVKACKNQSNSSSNRLNINHIFVLSYDYVPKISGALAIF